MFKTHILGGTREFYLIMAENKKDLLDWVNSLRLALDAYKSNKENKDQNKWPRMMGVTSVEFDDAPSDNTPLPSAREVNKAKKSLEEIGYPPDFFEVIISN